MPALFYISMMLGYLTVIKQTDGTYIPGGQNQDVYLGCDSLGFELSQTYLNIETGEDIGMLGSSYYDIGINSWIDIFKPVTKITDRCTGLFFYVTQKMSDIFSSCCEKDIGLCRTFQINGRCLIINGRHININ